MSAKDQPCGTPSKAINFVGTVENLEIRLYDINISKTEV